jgi:peroxiredoxin Q/BCP
VRDEIGQYQDLKVRPFGVNPAAPDKHAGYAERLRLPFVLLSDPEYSMARAYKATMPWKLGITRTVYLIGQDGKVKYAARGAPGADISLEALREKNV